MTSRFHLTLDRSANVLSNRYLFPDKGHDSNPGQNVLARQPLARDTVGEGLRAVRARLAQVPHEQRHVGPDKEKHLMVHLMEEKVIKWHGAEESLSECESHNGGGTWKRSGVYLFMVCVLQAVEKAHQVNFQSKSTAPSVVSIP